jgi:hypothetical protein
MEQTSKQHACRVNRREHAPESGVALLALVACKEIRAIRARQAPAPVVITAARALPIMCPASITHTMPVTWQERAIGRNGLTITGDTVRAVERFRTRATVVASPANITAARVVVRMEGAVAGTVCGGRWSRRAQRAVDCNAALAVAVATQRSCRLSPSSSTCISVHCIWKPIPTVRRAPRVVTTRRTALAAVHNKLAVYFGHRNVVTGGPRCM